MEQTTKEYLINIVRMAKVEQVIQNEASKLMKNNTICFPVSMVGKKFQLVVQS